MILRQTSLYRGVMQKFLEIGKILRPHGIKGAVKLQSYLDDVDFSMFRRVYIGHKAIAGNIVQVQPLNNDSYALTIDIISSVEMAEKYRNQSVYIDRTEYGLLKDKVYLSDLMHKPVLNEQGAKLGEVVDYDDYGASVILTKRCGAESYMLPYVENLIRYSEENDAFIVNEETFKDNRV